MSKPEVGQKLHAKYAADGEFYAAEVVAVKKKGGKAPYKVAYRGFTDSDAWVSLEDLKCKSLGLTGAPSKPEAASKKKGKSEPEPKGKAQGTPEVGQKLHAKYNGEFYAAEVLAVKKKGKAPYKVAYKGFPDSDAWVGLDDLKCKSLGLTGTASKAEVASTKKGKVEPEPKGKAKAKAKANGKPIQPQETPNIGDKAQAPGPDGKFVAVEVVGAKLQLKFADGKTKWMALDEIKIKKTPQFACLYCSRKFVTEDGRDNHWWDAHVVTCNECGLMFDNETLRDEHWWNVHVAKSTCKQCGLICDSVKSLVAHVREKHAIKCKQCGKECASIQSLVKHARETHQYEQNLIEVGKDKKEGQKKGKK